MACRNISTFTKYRVEHSTGEYFLKNTLAEKSYKKIMEETRAIQERMKETFGMGLRPKNKVYIQVQCLLTGKLHEYRSREHYGFSHPFLTFGFPQLFRR